MRGWMSVAVALVLSAVLSVPVFNMTRYSPATVVSRYLSALADGNGAKARGLLRGPEVENTDGMTDAVIKGAQGVPTQVRTKVQESGKNTARVQAKYVLGSSPYSTVFVVERAPRTWGMFSQWEIRVDEWPTITVSGPQAQAAHFNNQPMANGTHDVPVLFPLRYGVSFNEKYVKSANQNVSVVEAGKNYSVTVDADPTPDLQEKASKVLAQQLKQCTKQKVLMPTGCAFGYSTDNTILGDVKWELVEVPEVAIVRDRTSSLQTAGGSNSAKKTDDKAQFGGLRMRPAEAKFIISGRYRDTRTGTETDFREEVTELISANIILTDDGNVEVKQFETDS